MLFEVEVKRKRKTQEQSWDIRITGDKVTLSKKLVENLQNKSIAYGKPTGSDKYAFVFLEGNTGAYYRSSKRGEKGAFFTIPEISNQYSNGEYTFVQDGVYNYPVSTQVSLEVETHEADNVEINQGVVYNSVEENMFNN